MLLRATTMDKKVFSLALIWTASLSFVYSALVNVDDTSSAFTYTGGTWTKHTNVADSFQLYQSSDTFSSTQGAVATFTYTGGNFQYWGNQGPFHGNCHVVVDGVDQSIIVNSFALADGPPILLYNSTNLQYGDHSVTVQVVDASKPNVCEVDRFVYDDTRPTSTGVSSTYSKVASSSSSTSSSTVGNSSDSSSSFPIAAVAGGVAGGVVIVLLGLLILLCRRKRRNHVQQGPLADLQKTSAGLDSAKESDYSPPTIVSHPFVPPATTSSYSGQESPRALSDTSGTYSLSTSHVMSGYPSAASEKRLLRLDPPVEDDSHLQVAGPSATAAVPRPSLTANFAANSPQRGTLTTEQLQLVDTLTQRGVTGEALATVIASMTTGSGQSSGSVKHVVSEPEGAPPAYHDQNMP